MGSPDLELELNVISAKGLKDIGRFSKMDVYVAVTINGDPRTELRTPVDEDGGSNPKWSHPMKFQIIDEQLKSSLLFRLRHERVLFGDKDVGQVHVPVKELLHKFSTGNDNNNANAVLAEFPVRLASGKQNGKLKFSYKFGSAHDGSHNHYPVYAATPVFGPYNKRPPTSVTNPYPSSGLFVPPPTGYPVAPAGYPGSHQGIMLLPPQGTLVFP